MSQKTEVLQEICRLVKAINDCWVEGGYDELRRYFHDGMLLAMPGFEKRIHGAGPILDSYRDFGTKAHIHSFEADEPQIDFLERGSSAIAATGFTIDYEFDGTRYRETGTDLLAFAKIDGGWRVWWRTVIPGTSETV